MNHDKPPKNSVSNDSAKRSLKKRIEENAIIIFFSIAIASFTAGITAYRVILEITNQETVIKGTWVAKEDAAKMIEMTGATDERANIIRKFFSKIESRNFDEAWSLIHKARKVEIAGTVKNADDFARSYQTTRTQQNIHIEMDSTNEFAANYWVSYDVEDQFPENSFYESRMKTLKDFFDNGMLDRNKTLNAIYENLRTYFVLSNSDEGRVERLVSQEPIDFLFAPEFISEIGRILQLQRQPDYDNMQQVATWRHYILYLTLMEEDGDWKIRNGLYPPIAVVVYKPGTILPSK